MRRWIWLCLLLPAWSAAEGPVVGHDCTVSWQAPTTNTDGSPLTDLAAYRLYYSTIPGGTSVMKEVGLTTSTVLESLMPDTRYYITVSAVDATGNEGPRSAEVSAQTAPEPSVGADTTLPQVAITSPAGGGIVPRDQAITVQTLAVDEGGIASVEMFVNNVKLCSTSTVPYQCLWRVPAARATSYRLRARAVDQAGNIGDSPTIVVKTPS